jgi:non-heme Fe2+,alpha-ketoglutarate-dependent halogenase
MQADYARDGFLSPFTPLTPEEAARYRDGYLRIAKALGGAPKATELALLHLYYDWAWALIHHPKVLDAVESVLGPNILVWASSVVPKRAQDPGYISMHQDGTYWGLDQGEITSAWIALTPSQPENGCMRVVPGSHQKPILPHRETWAENNLLTRGQEIEAEVSEDEIVDIALQPGQMSLHHVRIIHGSNPNPSNTPRIGFAVRYMTPDVRSEGVDHPAVLVRGKDTHGNWDLMESPPHYITFSEAFAAHRQASAEHLKALTSTPSAAR